MKKLLLLLLLLPGALSLSASQINATDAWPNMAGLRANSGVGPTYALSSALSGTASSPISMTAYSGAFISVTGAAGLQVDVQWCIDYSQALPMRTTTKNWFTSDIIPANTTKYVAKEGSTMRLLVDSNVSSYQGAISAWNVTAAYLPVVNGETVGVGSPLNRADLNLASVTAWTYIYCTCTAQPCDVTFQNTASNSTMFWSVQPSSAATPASTGFQMPAGSPPLNVPVSPGQNWFFWSFTGGGSGVEQNHW